MRAFIAFLKKELLESARSGKLVLFGILFFAFGIMNPAIAKLTPWLFDLLSEQLAESGMAITEVTVDALTSWAQFFKNIPMALIVFVCVYGGTLAKEYATGTLVLVFTKGLARYKVVLAKATLLLSLWTVGYWLCFGITYGYNAYFWDNSVAVGLMPAALNWWLFGIFTVALMILFSVVSNGYGTVLLGTGVCVLASYLLGLIPRLAKYTPTSLMNSAALLVGAEKQGDHLWGITVTLVIIAACIGASIPVFNKKQI